MLSDILEKIAKKPKSGTQKYIDYYKIKHYRYIMSVKCDKTFYPADLRSPLIDYRTTTCMAVAHMLPFLYPYGFGIII